MMKRSLTGIAVLVLFLITIVAADTHSGSADHQMLTVAGRVDTLARLEREEFVEVRQLLVSLRCGTCHIETEDGRANDMFAPTFTRISERMDSTGIPVIAEFLLDPSVARPGIQMPGYWGSQASGHIRAMRSRLFTTPEAQTIAVARYIYYMTRMQQEER